MLGIGWSLVDDDGRAFGHLLDYKNSWNYLPYHSVISIDRYLAKWRGLIYKLRKMFILLPNVSMAQ
jgi:hypothetical protein